MMSEPRTSDMLSTVIKEADSNLLNSIMSVNPKKMMQNDLSSLKTLVKIDKLLTDIYCDKLSIDTACIKYYGKIVYSGTLVRTFERKTVNELKELPRTKVLIVFKNIETQKCTIALLPQSKSRSEYITWFKSENFPIFKNCIQELTDADRAADILIPMITYDEPSITKFIKLLFEYELFANDLQKLMKAKGKVVLMKKKPMLQVDEYGYIGPGAIIELIADKEVEPFGFEMTALLIKLHEIRTGITFAHSNYYCIAKSYELLTKMLAKVFAAPLMVPLRNKLIFIKSLILFTGQIRYNMEVIPKNDTIDNIIARFTVPKVDFAGLLPIDKGIIKMDYYSDADPDTYCLSGLFSGLPKMAVNKDYILTFNEIVEFYSMLKIMQKNYREFMLAKMVPRKYVIYSKKVYNKLMIKSDKNAELMNENKLTGNKIINSNQLRGIYLYCNYGLNFYKFAEICEHIYDKINTDTHKCIEFHSAYRNNYKEIKNNAFTKQRLQKPKPYVPKPKPQAPVVDEEGFTKVNNKKLTKKYKKH